MKKYFLICLFFAGMSQAQFEAVPDSPLDTNMGEAAQNAGATLNQITPDKRFEKQQEEERQEELLENRYDVPNNKEEEKFNKNGN